MSTASDSLDINSKEYQKFLSIKEEIRKMSSKHTTTIHHQLESFNPPKKPISIIIYANRVQDYIEECLDSIEKQTWFINNNNFEIIIGVDNCEDTLIKLYEIKTKYRNIKIYKTQKKLGLYVTLNTLLDLVKYNSILRFNAEDIMKPQMIEEILKYSDDYDLVKFNYDYFDEETTNIIIKKYWFNEGIFLFNHRVIQLVGGYQNWVLGADIELYERVYNFVKVKELEDSLFYKRKKEEDIKLSKNRKLRNIYKKNIRRYDISENIWINKIVEAQTTTDIKNVKKEPEQIITDEPVSIIIAAYKAQNFIEECLNSISRQDYFITNDKYEILIGVDGCYDTLYQLMKIRYKYKNLRIFMMKDNKGAYVTTNTLLNLVKYENIIIFGADDVMKSIMVSEIMNYSTTYDIVRFGFDDFSDNIRNITRSNYMRAVGAIFYKKHVIDEAGGYRDWKCSADFEFLRRVESRYKIKEINKALFFRRDHSDSLSNRSDTGLNTVLRAEYNRQVRRYSKDEKIKIERIINEHIEIQNIIDLKKDSTSILNKLFKKPIDKLPSIEQPIIDVENVLEDNLDEKFPISIIIAAYKAQDYIEECLDSIINQSYFVDYNNYEILVGVDACEDTLNKLLNIRNKYLNLRIFMMEKNNGTYITFNTLLDLCQNENIFIFGADDIMHKDMIGEVMQYSQNNDVIRFNFYNFQNDIKNILNINKYPGIGAIFFKKRIIQLAGGYREWRCAADSELLKRIDNHVKTFIIEKPLFYRRIHENSMTQRKDTGSNSDLRNQYKKQIRYYSKNENIKIEKVTSRYKEYVRKNKIAICIPMYERYNITNFVFNYYKQIQEQLLNEIEIILISCGSENEISKSIAEKNNFIYIEYPNRPLSQKVNQLYLKAKEYNPDACIKIDSDSIISKEFFKYYDNLIREKYDYAGIEDIYFLIKDYFCYWSGYDNYRKGETIGVGRFLSNNLLRQLNWMPWQNIYVDRGLDINLTKNIENLNNKNLKFTKTRCDNIGGMCIDIKGDIGISNIGGFCFEKIFRVSDININIDFSPIYNNLLSYNINNLKLLKK